MENQRLVLNRLKTARGHLDWVIRMVEADAYCPDVMKQLAAVQGMLEGTSREVLRNHLSTCVAEAMREGRTEEIVDELMETLKYDKRVFRPTPGETSEAGAQPAPAGTPEAGVQPASAGATEARDRSEIGG